MAQEAPDWARDDPPVQVAQAPDWARDPIPAPPPRPTSPEPPDWAQTIAPAPPEEKPTETTGTMPGVLEAAGQGFGAGIRGVGQSIQSVGGAKPTAQEDSPAAQPLEWGDVTSPYSKLAPKLAYGFAKSSPTIAGGVLGAGAGMLTPIPGGALAGGALGAGVGSVAQTLGPVFADELKRSPNDPNGAWDRAVKQATVSGLFSGASWAAFPLGQALGPAKQILFQALGVQPGLAMAERGTQNILAGRDTMEGMGEAYAQGAVATAIPAAGHALVSKAFGRPSTAAPRSLNPNEDAVLSRMGEPENNRSWIPSFNRLYTMVKDDLNPIREVRNILNEGNPALAAERDPYILARLTRGSYGKAEHMLEHATFDPISGTNVGKGLRQILDPVKDDLEGFRAYMLARRAVELDAQGIQTGIPIPEAHNVLHQGHNQYAPIFSEFRLYQKHLLDYLVKSGVVSREARDAMETAHKDYVPFYRLMEDSGQDTGHPGTSMRVRNPIQGIRGSERQILDPIESTIKNTYLYVSLADKNLALQALEDLAHSSPRGTEYLEPVSKTVRPITVTPEETARAVNKMPGAALTGTPDEFTIFRPNAFRPAPDEIAIFRDGQRHVYRTDPYLAAAVNGLDREAIGTLTKLIAAPARWLRAGATLSPEFIARNPIRDQFSAFVFSALGRGYVPFYDFIKGLGSVLRKDEGYQSWLKSGGANSAMVSIDRNYVENLVQRMKDPTFLGTVKNVAGSPMELLRATSELAENATRVGEHKRLMARGETPQAAGFASREITLDFQRIGSKMRAMNAIVAFFNAQAEGVDRAFRSLGTQPGRFLMTVGAGITLPSWYLWQANKDDPRMKEIPRWEKDLFWIIPTDKWEPVSEKDAKRAPPGYTRQRQDGSWEINNGNIWRVPKPFELGVIFGSVPERILDAYYQKDPNAFKGIGGTLKQAFIPNYYPQIALPAIEQFANRSLFTDRPLIPKYLQDMMPQYQANPYTTDTAKLIGNFIAKIPGLQESSIASPIMVENYIRAWTGGLGKHALDGSDYILRTAGLVPSRVEPTPTNADRVLLKAFAVRFPEAGANSVQDFYEEYERRAKVKSTSRYLTKTGEAEQGQALLRDNVIATADTLHRAIGTQLKLVRDVYRNPKMSPEEKRKFIDLSYMQVIKMAQTGNLIFKQTKDAFLERQKEP